MEKCHLRNFSRQFKKISEIEGRLHCLRGMDVPGLNCLPLQYRVGIPKVRLMI